MDSPSPARLWTGRALSGLAVLFLAVDALVKVLALSPAVQATAELGYAESVVVPIGLVLLLGVVLYVVPRTSALGAIYLTGYLGGAVATHVRVGNPMLGFTMFPVYVAVVLWSGLALRSPRLLEVLLGRREAV